MSEAMEDKLNTAVASLSELDLSRCERIVIERDGDSVHVTLEPGLLLCSSGADKLPKA
jgi:hypothetical protein